MASSLAANRKIEEAAMQVRTEDRGDARLVLVEEERIDAACAIQFKEAVRGAAGGGGGRVVVDLSRVRFLDSSGLGALVAAMKLLGTGRRLELADLQPTVERVFRLTRMDSVFTIHPTVEAAVGPADGLTDAG